MTNKLSISFKSLLSAYRALLLRHPARMPIAGFAFLILIGTGLLMLPVSTSDSSVMGLTDALFTATSAACVTGLTVLDTGTDFSAFGQYVILTLIQIGGLGIMTISTLILLIAGRRPSLANQNVLQDNFSLYREMNLSELLKKIIIYTLFVEVVGTVLMFPYFFTDFEFKDAVYMALFHAVSAFCNAGFSLFSDSFTSYRENLPINLIISALVIFGGIGFLVLYDIRINIFRRRQQWARLSLHSKVVLATSAVLLVAGTLFILVMEWHNSLAPLTIKGRILSAFFQSVNTRTSGFNSLPIGAMANETLFVMTLFMFIGASPGSCGGGIKTTTFATLFILGISRFRGHERPQLFRRTISEQSVTKATSILMISFVVVCIGLILLLATELGETPHFESRGKFLELLFEVSSAFGTVGLSTGITANLSTAGKLIISIIMFVGRLGPMLIAVALMRPFTTRYYYAEDKIMIG